jgi:cholesterol transport system auxiliary component
MSIRISRRSLPGALALAAAFGAAGCISKPVQEPQSFTIDPPAHRAVTRAADAHVLSLDWVEVAPLYAGSELAFRVGEHAIERDPYASLAAPAASLLTSAIRGYLLDADFVRDVERPGGNVPPDATVEVYVSELFGDLTNPADASAVMTLQFRVLVPAAGTTPVREISRKTYSQRVRLSQRTAQALATAWNQELATIMGEFLADLKPLMPGGRPSGS